MHRLIYALEPGLPVIDRLLLLQEDLAEPLRQLGAEVRWTAADQLRLVLRVLDVPAGAAVDRLRDQARSVARSHGEFSFGVFGTAFDPTEDAARLLYAGTGPEDAGVAELRRRLDRAIEDAGVPLDPRPWFPRILLGRLRTPRGPVDLEGVLRRHAETDWGRHPIREMVVLQSTLQAGVARMRVVERLAFGTGR